MSTIRGISQHETQSFPVKRQLVRTYSTTSGEGVEPECRNSTSDTVFRRSHVASRFSAAMDHIQSRLFMASQRLNDLTGYSGIESMKREIKAQGIAISGASSDQGHVNRDL